MRGYQFGSFHLDVSRRLLLRDSEVIPLTPKAYDLLIVLVENGGKLIEKEELIRQVWQDAIVEEGNLSVNISGLRKALGDNLQDHRFILTHSGRGYSFVADVAVVADGQPTPSLKSATPGNFEPQVSIEPSGGALPLDTPYYIERQTDDEFRKALARHDSIVLVKGPRQTGKTSLLARGFQHSRLGGARVVLTDFQNLNADYLQSLDKLLRMLAELIADQLDLEVSPASMWNSLIGPSANFERFWRREVLKKISDPIIWGLDEVDQLFHSVYASEVFSLFRSWHNNRALDPGGPWSRLTLALAYATEAHLFITDLNQSPFNVGTRLHLEDFTPEQVVELNHRYGSPLGSIQDLVEFFKLVGGHPYLVNHGLREIKARELKLESFNEQAAREAGIFGDHLRRLRISIQRDSDTTEAVRNLLQGGPCPTPDSFYRLRSAGVVNGNSARDAAIRCDLYRIYLQANLLN